ncbi:MAG: type II secretion system protein [Candidatus Niyogibacteria bacterium]|nr:type II secretion system protein [Candidatus Niyogibacteria bacterium]
MTNQKFSEKNKGFTIIELLVVLAIATFLLSIVFVSVREARAKGRDARREEDMKQLQNALNIYHVNSRSFPTCSLGVITGINDCLSQALRSDDTVGSVSTDPLGGGTGTCLDAASHVYCYESADGSAYTMHYSLETDSIPGKSSGWQQVNP